MYFQRIQSYLEIERSNWINQHITWANRPITLLSPFFADYKLALLAHHFTSKIYNLLTINFPEYRSSKPCVRSLNKIIALEHILQYQYLRSIRSNYQYGLTRLSAFRSDLEIKLVYIKESDKPPKGFSTLLINSKCFSVLATIVFMKSHILNMKS